MPDRASDYRPRLPRVVPAGGHCVVKTSGKPHYNLNFVGIPCILSEEDRDLNAFHHKLVEIVRNERRLFIVDHVPRMASIDWLRDHIHMMKAYKHWEYELKGYLDYALEHQSTEGFFLEIVLPIDDNHVDWANPDCVVRDEKNGLAFVRLEVEADIEYLVVEGVTTVYRVTGDEAWLAAALPRLEKAIDYCTSNSKRWDPEHGLVKRAFTIDTWDFKYGSPTLGIEGRTLRPDEPMSIMHGDNSGVYQAMRNLAWLNGRLGREGGKREWEERAARLKDNLNRTCWNGRFYTHQVHLGHAGVPGVDEREMLSMSNTYDMNRGVTDPAQAGSILAEYQRRRATAGTFAEWFTVNPGYPLFNGTPCPSGVNGAITSFGAGELAKAAFQNGEEAYGWDILRRLRAMVERDGTLHHFYHPSTGAMEPDLAGGGWGASAILSAIDEGLAGIVDDGVQYDALRFSPRWPVTGLRKVGYVTGYEAGRSLVETVYEGDGSRMAYSLSCPSRSVLGHLLLPQGVSSCGRVLWNGGPLAFTISRVNQSTYVDFSFVQNDAPRDRSIWHPLHENLIEVTF